MAPLVRAPQSAHAQVPQRYSRRLVLRITLVLGGASYRLGRDRVKLVNVKIKIRVRVVLVRVGRLRSIQR